jgi:hypothetical protein
MESESRNFVLTAAISLLVIAIGVVIAYFTKNTSAPSITDTAPVTQAIMPAVLPAESPPLSGDLAALLAPGALPDPGTNTSQPTAANPQTGLAAYQVIRGAELVPERLNRADRLRVRMGTEHYIFQLYNVEGLVRDTTDVAGLQRQTGYFHVEPTPLLKAGEEAYEYVKNLLLEKSFIIFTLWEPANGQGCYFAYILVEHKTNTKNFLSELLMARGYAMPSGRTQTIPFGGLSETEFRDRLRNFESMAREKKLGVWKASTAKPVR